MASSDRKGVAHDFRTRSGVGSVCVRSAKTNELSDLSRSLPVSPLEHAELLPQRTEERSAGVVVNHEFPEPPRVAVHMLSGAVLDREDGVGGRIRKAKRTAEAAVLLAFK